MSFQALGKNMPDTVWSNVVWPFALEPWKSNRQGHQLLQDYTAMTGNKFPNGHVYKGYQALQGLLEEFKHQILGLDADAAQLWGRLRVPDPAHALDKQIAATALVHDLTVVTRNVSDFAAVPGLRLLNPFLDSGPA